MSSPKRMSTLLFISLALGLGGMYLMFADAVTSGTYVVAANSKTIIAAVLCVVSYVLYKLAPNARTENTIEQQKPFHEKECAPATPSVKRQQDAPRAKSGKAKVHHVKGGTCCPKCGSGHVTFLKRYDSSSLGRAIISDEVAGTNGMYTGNAMYRLGKREYRCDDCGRRFFIAN